MFLRISRLCLSAGYGERGEEEAARGQEMRRQRADHAECPDMEAPSGDRKKGE